MCPCRYAIDGSDEAWDDALSGKAKPGHVSVKRLVIVWHFVRCACVSNSKEHKFALMFDTGNYVPAIYPWCSWPLILLRDDSDLSFLLESILFFVVLLVRWFLSALGNNQQTRQIAVMQQLLGGLVKTAA